jgi:hypothetical protein
VVLLWPGTNYLYFGSHDALGGQKPGLIEIDVSLANPQPTRKKVQLESALAVAVPGFIGAPSLDTGYNLLHVGSEAGTLYAVQVPF